MTEIPQALQERMVALVRQMASADGACFVSEYKEDAREIVAELPAPVDPDLLLARKACAKMEVFRTVRNDVFAGRYDDGSILRETLAAIKRVRSERHDRPMGE